MTCQHPQIRTWLFEDTQEPAGMWSCMACGLRFDPRIATTGNVAESKEDQGVEKTAS